MVRGMNIGFIKSANRSHILAHSCRFIVLTGGPGAGKTAVMEAVRQIFCEHIAILPESASIVYGGGYPRKNTPLGIQSAQRAICSVQHELERYVVEEGKAVVALCDRGIVDSAAYWPQGADQPNFYEAIGFSQEALFARYHTVIHMKTPTADRGYDLSNPMRIETPEQAAALDARTAAVWQSHPNRFVVEATNQFTDKINQVTNLILEAMPFCCSHMKDAYEKRKQAALASTPVNPLP